MRWISSLHPKEGTRLEGRDWKNQDVRLGNRHVGQPEGRRPAIHRRLRHDGRDSYANLRSAGLTSSAGPSCAADVHTHHVNGAAALDFALVHLVLGRQLKKSVPEQWFDRYLARWRIGRILPELRRLAILTPGGCFGGLQVALSLSRLAQRPRRAQEPLWGPIYRSLWHFFSSLQGRG
jgi:hypothetical protein